MQASDVSGLDVPEGQSLLAAWNTDLPFGGYWLWMDIGDAMPDVTIWQYANGSGRGSVPMRVTARASSCSRVLAITRGTP